MAAWTLTELLVVLALIIVLAALLLGALPGVRARTKTAQCLGTHRQIVLALIEYAGENNGWLPPYYDENKVTWGRFIAPYLQTDQIPGYRVLRCPAARDTVTTTIGVHYSQQPGKAPFGISFAPYPGSKKLAAISRGTVLTADIENPSGHSWFLSPNEFALTLDADGDGVKETRPGQPPGNWFVFRHNGHNVCSLADGSVKAVAAREWGLNENRLWGP